MGKKFIEIKLDLVGAALEQLDFLQHVNRYQGLYAGPEVANAIRRYEFLWLPLVAEFGSRVQLEPPLDIAWVWHCHMLAPYNYHKDVHAIAGRVLDHRYIPQAKKEEALKVTIFH